MEYEEKSQKCLWLITKKCQKVPHSITIVCAPSGWNVLLFKTVYSIKVERRRDEKELGSSSSGRLLSPDRQYIYGLRQELFKLRKS